MSAEDAAVRWGLPPGFSPARFPIAEDVKELLRDMLRPGEPVIVTLGNEGNSIFIVATPQRVFSIRSGLVAGITGFTVREFPWEGISDLRLQAAALNVKIAIHFKSTDGRTVEVGRRAALAKSAVDNLAPFETHAGTQAFEAIHTVWHYKKNAPTTGEE
ncbi:MAG TPA: hypothetical protein VF600_15470 [Abditibacteriaceae bacterium]|jgi:hypothetical protein